MKKTTLLLCLSLSSLFLATRFAAAQTLVADINQLPKGSNPNLIRTAPNGVVFLADSKEYGLELFQSDGTDAGTKLILDAAKGPTSGNYLSVEVLNERCYFLTYEGTTVTLWRYNFLNDQLAALKEFKGINNPSGGYFTRVGSEIYFWLRNNTTLELWKFRASSTQVDLVATLPATQDLVEMNSLNNTLVFTTRSFSGTAAIWRSNGSSATTQVIREFTGSNPIAFGLVAFQGKLLFVAREETYGQEIWSTDGNTASLFLDLVPGAGSSLALNLRVNNGFLYFVAQTKTNGGAKVWRSNGTKAGTLPMGNNFSSKQQSYQFKPLQSFDIGVFASVYNDSTKSDELWYYEAMASRVIKIKTLAEPPYSDNKFFQGVTSANAYYFLAHDPQRGTELWTIRNSALTPPRLLKDIYPGNGSSNIRNLTPSSGRVFFSAEDDKNGRELWMSNGTDKTFMVKVLNDQNDGSYPGNFFVFQNYFLFTATHPATGNELWVSKGNGPSTVLLKDINPGRNSSYPSNFMPLKDLTFLFNASTDSLGAELWRSMVTSERGTLVKDVNPGYLPGAYSKMGKLKDKVLFAGQTPETGNELWISDGTAAGTKLLKDIWPGASSSQPIFYGEAGTFGDSIVIFKADDGKSGEEFWRSNGTAAGTYQLVDFNPGLQGSGAYQGFTRIGKYAYFNVIDKTQNVRIWRTNGKSVELVADAYGSGDQFVGYQGKILFSGYTPATGAELWCYDTLGKYSFLLNDINPGVASSNPAHFKVFNNEVYFSANDGKYGAELWKTNGDRNFTTLFQDINPGLPSSFPRELLPNGNFLHFSAEEPLTGRELWYMPAGAPYAKLRFDLNKGKASSNPSELTLYLNELLFRADDGLIGQELWKTAMPDVATFVEPSVDLAQVEAPLLAKGLNELPKLALYPNPSADYLQVQMPLDNLKLEVYDGLGRRVLPTVSFSQSAEVMVKNLVPGQYYLKVYDGQQKLVAAQAFQKR